MPSRSAVYGRLPIIAICTAAMISPPSSPSAAKAITAIADEEAAAPIRAELQALSAMKKSTERGELARRIDDATAEDAFLMQLADWCATVAGNLDALDYRGKRAALDALGLRARVWRADHDPRYEISLNLEIVEPGSLSEYTPR